MNDERYISVEKSIINACREVKEMQLGKLAEPTLEIFFEEMNQLLKARTNEKLISTIAFY